VPPRASFLNDSYEYGPADPGGYRAGVINIGKAIGARALAVKLFEIPAGQHVCPDHCEWRLMVDGETRENWRLPFHVHSGQQQR